MALVIPLGMSLLAALVLLGGLRWAGKAKRPRLLKIGAGLAAAGIMLLWLLPWLLFSEDRGAWAMPMFIAALFVAVSVLGAGLQSMARACGAREATRGDQLFEDFVRHTTFPSRPGASGEPVAGIK